MILIFLDQYELNGNVIDNVDDFNVLYTAPERVMVQKPNNINIDDSDDSNALPGYTAPAREIVQKQKNINMEFENNNSVEDNNLVQILTIAGKNHIRIF